MQYFDFIDLLLLAGILIMFLILALYLGTKALAKVTDVDPEEFITISSDQFKTESDYLKRKRQELIEKDLSNKNPKLLVNNPTRPVSLRKNFVLN